MKTPVIGKLVGQVTLIFILALSGCATQQYHNWNEKGVAATATITSSETVLLESINGRETGAGFIGQEHTYELPTGTYALVVTYADLFDITTDDFEKVRSNPLKLTLTMEAGKQYRLSHKKVATLKEAKAFAKKPQINIVDSETGKAVEVAVEYTTPKSILSRLRSLGESEQVFASDYLNKTESAPAPAPALEKKPAEENSSVGSEISALKMLQFSWQQASQKEREEFLRWIK